MLREKLFLYNVFANIKDTDQTVHLHSLISIFDF